MRAVATAQAANAGAPARPTVEVRADGVLIRRVSEGDAEMLVSRGWAQWRASGRRRHLALAESAPLSALPSWPGHYGTRPMRADGSGERAAGQVLGEHQSHLEPIPTRRLEA